MVAYFDGVGTVLMNNLMYTSKKSGVLMKYTGDRARWSFDEVNAEEKQELEQEQGGMVLSLMFAVNETLWHKVGILFTSCLAFFLLSTSTAMLIRILLSSGVIILYPILMLLEVLPACSLLIYVTLVVVVCNMTIVVVLSVTHQRLVCMQCVFSRGFSMRTAYRLMTLAYPWLGVPMELLRLRSMSVLPFLIAHATQIFVYYVMYEGVQVG
jgi:hypothetical protein